MKTADDIANMFTEGTRKVEILLEDSSQRQIALTIYRIEDKYYLFEGGVDARLGHVYHIDWDDLSKAELLSQFYTEVAVAALNGYQVISIDSTPFIGVR